jgi:hypothetical protein
MAHYKTAQAQKIPSSKMGQIEMTYARINPTHETVQAQNGPRPKMAQGTKWPTVLLNFLDV